MKDLSARQGAIDFMAAQTGTIAVSPALAKVLRKSGITDGYVMAKAEALPVSDTERRILADAAAARKRSQEKKNPIS